MVTEIQKIKLNWNNDEYMEECGGGEGFKTFFFLIYEHRTLRTPFSVSNKNPSFKTCKHLDMEVVLLN